MDLRGVNADLVRDQVIAELIIESESGNVKDADHEENRDCPYKYVSEDEAPPDFPEHPVSGTPKNSPKIEDRGNS